MGDEQRRKYCCRFQALFHNATGESNIAAGFNAGLNLTTGSNNIDIGNGGVAGDANKIRIGKQGTQNGTFIASIHGVAVTGSTVVFGHLTLSFSNFGDLSHRHDSGFEIERQSERGGVPSDHLDTGIMNTVIGSGAPSNCRLRMTGEPGISAPQVARSLSGT
jgi:hypothetical protein